MHPARLKSRISLRVPVFLLGVVLAGLNAFSNAWAGPEVDGRCNIFGAGHATPPAPAGGGGGLLPVEVALPGNADVVQFFGVSGSVLCCGTSANPNGPDGGNDRGLGIDILSFGGISGILDSNRYMFLTGVFLDASEPSGIPPDRLDFGPSALTDAFTEASPALRQTFFIGDGLTPSGVRQIFHVPPGATRLFLGFADGFAFSGDPGYFDDNGGALVMDSVQIVLPAPANHDPDCSAATASAPLLWPPNHQLVPESILGVTDPDGDPVTITVTGVTQDEPVGEAGSFVDLRDDPLTSGVGGDLSDAQGLDDGKGHCPDATIASTGEVTVRAERGGGGNGRVYVISFTASDGRGGSCRGSVQVCVPHDQSDLACTDDGQSFNALEVCPPNGGDNPLQATGVGLTTTGRAGRPTLQYTLAAASDVVIGVYDLAGRRVATLFNGRQSAGVHQIDWTPVGVERGMYFCRVQAGSMTATRSVLVLKR